jgi:large repetitive protein
MTRWILTRSTRAPHSAPPQSGTFHRTPVPWSVVPNVSITGTNFYNLSSVNVGSATVSAVCGVTPPLSDCYTVMSPTTITLYTPNGTSAGGGSGDPLPVTVTNSTGTPSNPLDYTYAQSTSTTTVSSSGNPSVSGQAVSFTANLPSGATGTVVFTITPSDDGPAVTCTGGDTVTVAASAAICSLSADALSLAYSPYAVSAVYSGDTNFIGSTGNLSPGQAVDQDPTTTATPTSTVNPSVYGQSVTYSTTVTPNAPGSGTPTGDVSFVETVGGNTTAMCGLSPLTISGAASCTSSILPPTGTASIHAEYLGDTNYYPSTSNGLVQFVDQSSTSTGLSSNLNNSGFGQPVTFTATVSPTAPGGGIPAGPVAFSADGNTLTGCSSVALNGSGQATCTTSSLSVADHTVTAASGGDANYLSSSGSLSQTVDEQATSTGEVSSVPTSLTGQSVAITANVSYTGSVTPTGTVTFTITPSSGLAPQCSGGNTVTLTGSASAICTLMLSSVGAPYAIHAEYNGDANYDASSSTDLTQNVNPASTTTSVATSAPNAVAGQTITFTATVAPVSPGGGVPSAGTVTFDINGNPVLACEDLTVTAGAATCTVSDLDVLGGPTYSVTADYTAGPGYASSDSASPLIQTIAPDPTSTSLVSNTNPSTFGQNVTFTATVTANSPGSGIPTGTATILADGSTLCTGVLDSGELTCSASTLPAGTHQLTATYTASADYGASNSPTLTQGVNQSSTTTAVTSSDNPSPFGDDVTVTATVSLSLPAWAHPPG